jgi:hypothetical protein
VYEGIWVGEDLPIPNTRGIRKDVVEALRRVKGAGDPLAGRVLCGRLSLARRSGPTRRAPARSIQRMEQRARAQRLWHA